jgi:sulfite exporter TauE/SafE
VISAFLAGVVLGIAGSAHCAAMCGPLLGALAPHGSRALLHHAGRGLAYVLLGVAAGLAGASMGALGLARWWAMALAGMLFLQAAARIVPIRPTGITAGATRGLLSLSSAVRRWSTGHPVAGPLGLGVANGLLPCGLVFGATSVAAGLADVPAAVMLMMGFASGTLPVLAVGAAAFNVLGRRAGVLRHLTPILLVVLAALLLARGLHVPGSPGHAH